MAWAAGVPHANITNMSSISQGVNTYYDKRFLRRALHQLRIAPLGQKRPLPKNAGNSVEFFAYNEIAVSMSGSYLTDGTNPDATLVTGRMVSATPAEWGNFSQHSRLVKDTHIDPQLKGISALWGSHAGNTIDLLCAMAVCSTGAYPVRADGESGDGTYSFRGTVDSATSTTIVDADMSSNTDYGDANDDANQSVVIITSGTGYGQVRPCTDYVTATGTITVSPAWDVTPAAGDTFDIVSAHGLTSTDILTTTNIRAGVVQLRNNLATPHESGYFVGVVDPTTEAGLMADTNWTNVMQYKDRPEIKTGGLFSGEIGEWGGVRWVRTTQPFRFPITTVGTAGAAYGVGALVPGTSYTNYSATGAIHANLIFGQEAFGCTTLKGNDYMSPGIIVKNPGPGDTSNPLNRFSTVGWYLPFIAKGLNGMFAVQLWSGDSA
jgi:N4-gp56 family major capsid protein